MKAPENDEFKLDERGIMTDPEEMLFVIHELACMLGSLVEDPRMQMMVGPQAIIMLMAAISAHEMSCDKHPEKREGPTPSFNLGADLNKIIGDL